MSRYLLIEDDPLIRKYIVEYFKIKGESIDEAFNGYEGLECLKQKEYDLVLLDILMPGIQGLDLCPRIKEKWNVPIIFISALVDNEHQLIAYELGADDYLAKPFSVSLLHAKCKAVIRRYQHFDEMKDHFKFHDLEIDEAMHQVYVEKQAITLTNREYQLLVYLLKHPNFIFSRGQLLDRIWGDDFYGDERVVDTYIKSIRKKIGVYARYIKTVYSVGYAFKEEL